MIALGNTMIEVKRSKLLYLWQKHKESRNSIIENRKRVHHCNAQCPFKEYSERETWDLAKIESCSVLEFVNNQNLKL